MDESRKFIVFDWTTADRQREGEAYFPKDELANVALAALMATGLSDAEAKDKLGMC